MTKSDWRTVWAAGLGKKFRTNLANHSVFRNDPTDPRHGTHNGYTDFGCRCRRCRDGEKAYRQNHKGSARPPGPRLRSTAAAFLANLDDPRHGTHNGYTNFGCRCERCVAGNRAYFRAYDRRTGRTYRSA